MLSDPYFIIAIDEQEYEELRMSRKSTIASPDNLSLEHGVIVLIYLRSSNKIIAEYDLEKVDANGGKDTLHLEPIYNSPEGVILTDLVLLTLPSNNLEKWRDLLKSQIFPIAETDYKELINRLKG